MNDLLQFAFDRYGIPHLKIFYVLGSIAAVYAFLMFRYACSSKDNIRGVSISTPIIGAALYLIVAGLFWLVRIDDKRALVEFFTAAKMEDVSFRQSGDYLYISRNNKDITNLRVSFLNRVVQEAYDEGYDVSLYKKWLPEKT